MIELYLLATMVVLLLGDYLMEEEAIPEPKLVVPQPDPLQGKVEKLETVGKLNPRRSHLGRSDHLQEISILLECVNDLRSSALSARIKKDALKNTVASLQKVNTHHIFASLTSSRTKRSSRPDMISTPKKSSSYARCTKR